MKFIVNKSQIVPVLAKIQGLTGRRSNLTITENILLRSVENGFSFPLLIWKLDLKDFTLRRSKKKEVSR
jgi:DNA polymerase III sliding clamp (beta) subunit (PCNA family)